MKQALIAPTSNDRTLFEELGYVESFDAVVDRLYAMLVYKETNLKTDKWVVRIKGSATAGAVIDPENKSLENALRKAVAHKEEYILWGNTMTPKEDDARKVENRLFFDGEGNITKLEIHLVTRDPDGNPLEEQVLGVDWPADTPAEPVSAVQRKSEATVVAGEEDFKTFYTQYQDACRTKNKDFHKSIMPDDVPADEFAGMLDFLQMGMKAVDASGITPTFARVNNRMDVIYDGDLGDGMTNWTLDFYLYMGKWVKYDPEA